MDVSKERLLELFLYFFGVFLYLWMNFVTITKIGNYFQIEAQIRVFILIFILSVSYLVTLRLERKITNKFTRILYVASVYWMGLLFIFFITITFFNVINRFYQIPFILTMIGICILFTIIIPFALRYGRILTIKELTFHDAKIKKPLTIIQLTDLHLGSIHTHKFVPRILKKIKDINYDAIVITGDLADGSAPITHDTIEAFDSITKPIYFVSGNHDYLNGVERFEKEVAKTPIQILKNESVNFKGIQIVGLEYSKHKNSIVNQLKKITFQKDLYTVLLNHTPVKLEKITEYPIDVILCGHTHHGQIKPAHLFAKIVYGRYQGLHKFKNTSMYIAPGTGNWGPPMRIGTRNEITLIHLKPSDSS